MNLEDTSFNNRIIFVTLVAVIIGILIAFYYSYAQSQQQISYLEKERNLLVRDLTLMKSEVDRLLALNEVNDIELQDKQSDKQKKDEEEAAKLRKQMGLD